MNKKIIIVSLALLLIVGMVPTALAFASGVTPPTALSQEQKQTFVDLQKQMLDLRTQMVQKQVDYGLITKDQAAALTTQIAERMANCQENGYVPGLGNGVGAGMMGKGRMGGMAGNGGRGMHFAPGNGQPVPTPAPINPR